MSAATTSAPVVRTPGVLRSLWRETNVIPRVTVLAVVVFAVASALVLATGAFPADAAQILSSFATISVPAATGLLFIINGRPHGGRAGLAWTCIGLGILSVAAGEALYQMAPRQASPGIADAFYLATYPLLFAGVLLLPHITGRKWERLRLTLDSIAGSVALGAIAWSLYLRDVWLAGAAERSFADAINLLYPIGDLALLVAVVILATRPSAYQFDGRLVTLWISLVLTVAANSAYALAVEDGSFEVGGPLDALWLLSFAFAAITTLFLARPPRYREVAYRPSSIWKMFAPYTAVAVLVALTIRDLTARGTVLEMATALVATLIIVRQGVAIREVREVVEKQRNDLVASISHELRTPLAAMGGFVEIMADNPDLPEPERVEMVDIVRGQTQHLTRIVGDLVDIARGKLSSATLSRSTFEVAKLLRASVGMIKGIDITIDAEPGLTLHGDEDRLRQVLVNFLSNAERYGGGEILVAASRTGGYVTIEVHDNGPGVPKKHEFAVWERFDRGAHAYTSAIQGSGLGLSIARQLAMAHEGRAGYRRSDRLGGACFWVMIPVD